MDKETEIRIRLLEIFRSRIEYYKKFAPGDLFHLRCNFCSLHCNVIGQVKFAVEYDKDIPLEFYRQLLNEAGWTSDAILDVLNKGDLPEDLLLSRLCLRFFIYDSLHCPYTDAGNSFDYPVRLDSSTFGELHLLREEGETL
jgi:hypothetical protein